MLGFFSSKEHIRIGGYKLKLDLSKPHEKNYKKSIVNEDYLISRSLVKEGDYVLDLGANIGFTALLYLSFGASKVYAFEPVYNLYQRIRNIKSDNIIAYNIALSNFEGESEMFLSSAHNQGHSLNKTWPTRFTNVFRESLTETVKVTTLDKLFPDRTFNFIKIDVEGMEKETIMGGDSFFRNNYNAILQIEIYEWQFEDTHRLLSKYFTKTFIPVIVGEKLIEFRDLNSFENIKEIKFSGPPNYIYANFDLK